MMPPLENVLLPAELLADEKAPDVPLAPKAGIIERLTGRSLTFEELREADLAMSANAELAARLGLPSADPALAAACRGLDGLLDEQARRRSVTWSQPAERAEQYRGQLMALLRGAVQLIGQDPKHGPVSDPGASIDVGRVWAELVIPSMLYIQAHRRRTLWGVELPEALSDHA